MSVKSYGRSQQGRAKKDMLIQCPQIEATKSRKEKTPHGLERGPRRLHNAAVSQTTGYVRQLPEAPGPLPGHARRLEDREI